MERSDNTELGDDLVRLRIAMGDADAFGEWFAQVELPLRKALRSFAGGVDVECVVNDTGLLVWKHAARIEPDGRPGFLLRWAVAVARNLARHECRRLGREVPFEEDDPGEAALADPAPDPFLRERIARCLADLKRRSRRVAEVLAARIESAGTEPDRCVAHRLRISHDAFRQSLSRARRILEECLRRSGIELRAHLG